MYVGALESSFIFEYCRVNVSSCITGNEGFSRDINFSTLDCVSKRDQTFCFQFYEFQLR